LTKNCQNNEEATDQRTVGVLVLIRGVVVTCSQREMQKGLAHTEQYGDRRGMSDGYLLVEKVGVDARGRAITMLTRRRNKDTESGSGWKATGKMRIRDDNGKLTWWSRGAGQRGLHH
jgi:hypothetical protein